MAKNKLNRFLLITIYGLACFSSVLAVKDLSAKDNGADVDSAVKKAASNCVNSLKPKPFSLRESGGSQGCEEYHKLQLAMEKECSDGDEDACKQLKTARNVISSNFLSSSNRNTFSEAQRAALATCSQNPVKPKPYRDSDSDIKKACREIQKLQMSNMRKCLKKGDPSACEFHWELLKEQVKQFSNPDNK